MCDTLRRQQQLGAPEEDRGAAAGSVSKQTPGRRLGVGGLDQHRVGPGGAQLHAGVLEDAPPAGEILGASGPHSDIAIHASGHGVMLGR